VKSQVVGLAVAIASFGLIGSAQADAINGILTLGASTSGSLTFDAGASPAGTVNVTITAPFSGGGFFDADDPLGTWTIGVSTPSPFGTATKVGGGYAVSGVTSSFTYSDIDGSLTGTLTFTSVRDDSPNPQLIGSFSGTGTGDMLGNYTNKHFDLTAATLTGFASLDALIAAKGKSVGGSSSGEIEGIPGPISGAGLPGLVAACIGLLFLGQRRRRQLTAA
jgi:hypothetical protein